MHKKIIAFLIGAIFISPLKVYAADTLKINLTDSINLALENNRAVEQSAKDRDSAQWAHARARRNTGPRLTWSASAMRIGGKDYDSARELHAMDNSNPAYKNEFTNAIGIEMPLYTGGQNEAEIGAARYNLNQADLILENTRQEIKYQTAAAYYQLLQAREIMHVEEEAVRLLQEHLDNVNIQYEVGTVAKSDVLASKVQLAGRQQSLMAANGNYYNAMADLNNLIGLSVDTVLIVEEELIYTPYRNSVENCTAYALKNRPDGIAAAYAIKQAEMILRGAKSGYRPSVSAVVEKNLSGESVFKENHSGSWNAGFRLNWDIFDNGITAAQANEAKAELEKVKSQALQLQDQIKLEVQKAFNDIVVAEMKISITGDAVTMAAEDFELVKLRYIEGIDTNLAVMDAQEKLTQTQTNYYNALYSYNVARAALDKAMGVPVNINVPVYVSTEQETNSANKALEKSAID